MITARSLSTIQSEYLSALAGSGSNLALDTVEGSLAYTMARGSAAVALSLDNRLLDLQATSSIFTATGNRLDELLSYVSSRQLATKAQGSVLAISKTDSTVIPAGSILINVSTGLSFITTSASVTAVNLFESLVNVVAIEAGSASNLPAGTQLYSADYPNVCFRVGETNNDIYLGDILGGENKETDNEYRTRVITLLSNPATASTNNLIAKLREYPAVDRAYVNTRTPGVIEIWVDGATSYTATETEDLLTYIKPYLAAGVIPFISQARRKSVNVTLDIKPFSTNTSDLTTLSNRVATSITNLIFGLAVGEGLLVSDIKRSVSALARSVSVVYPTENVTAQINEILVPGEIKYIYSSNLF